MLAKKVTWVLAFAAVLPACGGHPVSPVRTASPAAPAGPKGSGSGDVEALFVTPARVFPPLDRSEVTAEVKNSDGGRRFIAQGLRLIESAAGGLTASEEFLPGARMAASLELPARLGGGYLFVLNASGNSLFWRASSWTGALKPLARLQGEVERVVPGFDRVYAVRERGAPWVALDVESGQALELGSLPPSPGYGAMAFADEWFAAVELPLRGVLATFDAGGTWHPLGVPHAELSAADGGIVVAAPGRRFLLGPRGSESPLPEPAPDATRVAPKGEARRLPAPLPLGARPLETAVLHGLPDEPGTALIAARGMLARVRLKDGAILAQQVDAYAGRAPCDAVKLGAGGGFVCGEAHGGTRIYALEKGLSLALVQEFDEPRRVAPNGAGALVVSGSCAPRGAHEPARCVVPRAGAPFELSVRDPGERAVALTDGGVALITPFPPKPKNSPKKSPAAPARPGFTNAPRVSEAPLGTLTLVRPGVPEQTRSLRLVGVEDKAAGAIVESGFWLDSFQVSPGGELVGWVAGNDSFVGVRVKLDGSVLVGSPEQHLDRALLSGRFALVVGRSGGLRESVDGGFEWSDGEFPAEPDLRPQRTSGTTSGCTELGCAVSGWLRVGWKMGERDRLTMAQVPEPTGLPGAGGNRWSLQCEPTSEQSRAPLRKNPQSEDRAVSPWNPFAEVAPPTRGRADFGLETGNEADLRLFHAYAWGPAGDSWARDARWLVRVRDPQRVTDAIWSSAPTLSAWSSAVLASDAFGRSPSGPPSAWRLVTDPVRHAGLVLVSIRGAVELYLLEEGRALSRVKTTGAVGVITSVARAGSRFYVAALAEGRAFRLYRVEHGELAAVGEFPEVAGRSEAPTLAPATQGEGVGLWVHDADYYLFPFDDDAQRFDAPIVTRARDLAAMPTACSTGEDGYVVGDALSLEPNVELLRAGTGVATGNGIEVRLIVSPSRICAESVSAPLGSPADERARFQSAPPEVRAARPGALAVRTPSSALRGDRPPNAVSERDVGAGAPLVLAAPDGSRRGFRCRD